MPARYIEPVLALWSAHRERTVCTVVGNCMAPLIRQGDRVVIEHGRRSVRCGDVIVCRSAEGCWRTATLAVPNSAESALPRLRRQHRYANPCEGGWRTAAPAVPNSAESPLPRLGHNPCEGFRVQRVIRLVGRGADARVVVVGDQAAGAVSLGRDQIIGTVVEVETAYGRVRLDGPAARTLNRLAAAWSRFAARRGRTADVLRRIAERIVALPLRESPTGCGTASRLRRLLCRAYRRASPGREPLGIRARRTT